MVHISSDYVFDGTAEVHFEDEPPSPLGVYGQTKAAGEALVSTLAKHWIVRTSWAVGAGDNFVRTMARLADTGVYPSVVDDQRVRLTFAPNLAAAIIHLVTSAAPGIYNVSNGGPTLSWAEIARKIFELRGRSPGDVAATTTAAFSAGKMTAPRPIPPSRLPTGVACKQRLARDRSSATLFSAASVLGDQFSMHQPIGNLAARGQCRERSTIGSAWCQRIHAATVASKVTVAAETSLPSRDELSPRKSLNA